MSRLPSSMVSLLSPELADMDVPIIDAIANHLEFLGYEVIINDPMGQAIHPRRLKFSFYRSQIDVVTFVVFLGSKAYGMLVQEEFYKFINIFNETASVAQLSLGEDFEVISKFSYVGEYNRITFARMLELWETDIHALLTHKKSHNFI